MKFLSYSLFLAALIGVATCEPLRAQEKTEAVTSLFSSVIAGYRWVADIANPWLIPERYLKLASISGAELGTAVYESVAKLECNKRLGFACLQSLGVAALTVSPWLIWQIWGKEIYDNQITNFRIVKNTIKNHHKNAYHIIGNGQITIARNIALKACRKCKTMLTAYVCQDLMLVKLVNNFYNNFNNEQERNRALDRIKLYCKGYKRLS